MLWGHKYDFISSTKQGWYLPHLYKWTLVLRWKTRVPTSLSVSGVSMTKPTTYCYRENCPPCDGWADLKSRWENLKFWVEISSSLEISSVMHSAFLIFSVGKYFLKFCFKFCWKNLGIFEKYFSWYPYKIGFSKPPFYSLFLLLVDSVNWASWNPLQIVISPLS